MRGGVRASHHRHRERPDIPRPGEPVHRRREVPDDRRRPEGCRGAGLQHRSGGGSEPLLGVGCPRGVHGTAVPEGVQQQPDDPPPVPGGRIRRQGIPAVQQGGLLRDGGPPQDGGRRRVEVVSALRGGGRHREDRRGRKAQGHIRGKGRCTPPRPRRWPPPSRGGG